MLWGKIFCYKLNKDWSQCHVIYLEEIHKFISHWFSNNIIIAQFKSPMIKSLKRNLSRKLHLKLVIIWRELTLQLPWVTKTEFLLTILIQYQAGKWWESRKISIMGLLIDLIPNSPTNIIRIVWQTVRRITNEFLGVEGLKATHFLLYLP